MLAADLFTPTSNSRANPDSVTHFKLKQIAVSIAEQKTGTDCAVKDHILSLNHKIPVVSQLIVVLFFYEFFFFFFFF